MTSADFCPIIPCVTAQDAASKPGRPVGQISPDKSMNCHYTTPAFTVAPELRALLCCANLPRASALYAVSVRGLIVSESRYARLPALGIASLREQAAASVILFAVTPLPSASTSAYETNRYHKQSSRTGDLHPISSCPCRAYTSGLNQTISPLRPVGRRYVYSGEIAAQLNR